MNLKICCVPQSCITCPWTAYSLEDGRWVIILWIEHETYWLNTEGVMDELRRHCES